MEKLQAGTFDEREIGKFQGAAIHQILCLKRQLRAMIYGFVLENVAKNVHIVLVVEDVEDVFSVWHSFAF